MNRTGTPLQQERALGIAGHRAVISQDLGFAVVRATTDELAYDAYQALAERCTQAVLDGYELAGIVTGVVATGQGKRFARGVEATKFANRACVSGPALLAGPLGGTAKELVGEEPALLNALAAGILLHVHEHAIPHPSFAGLALAPTKRKAQEPPSGTAPPRPELLAQIFASPGDSGPRLVYADHLIEHGDPRGEFISSQCRRRLATFDERKGVAAREKALLATNERAWLAPIRPFIREWQWRRGFVSHVIANVDAFVNGYAALCEVPLASVKLTSMTPALAAKLGALAPHPTLHYVDISQQRLTPEDLAALVPSFLSRITWLDAWGNPLGDAGAAVLAPLPLRRLSLHRVGMTDAGIRALAEGPCWSTLERLDVGRNNVTDPEPLRAAPRLIWPQGELSQNGWIGQLFSD